MHREGQRTQDTGLRPHAHSDLTSVDIRQSETRCGQKRLRTQSAGSRGSPGQGWAGGRGSGEEAKAPSSFTALRTSSRRKHMGAQGRHRHRGQGGIGLHL